MLQYLSSIPKTGFGQMLWTALGDTECRQQVTAGITADALSLGIEGPAMTPSMVMYRVESLAAYNPRSLADIAMRWLPMEEVSADLYDSTADLWASAWAVALRHLKSIGAVTKPSRTIANYQVHREAELVFAPEDRRPITWDEVISELNAQDWDYRATRKLDTRVAVHGVVDSALLFKVLEYPGELCGSPQRWRIFRHRIRQFDDSARHAVEVSVNDLWERPSSKARVSSDAVVLLELAKQLHVDMRRFARDLPGILGDEIAIEDILTVSYVIMREEWFTP